MELCFFCSNDAIAQTANILVIVMIFLYENELNMCRAKLSVTKIVSFNFMQLENTLQSSSYLCYFK